MLYLVTINFTLKNNVIEYKNIILTTSDAATILNKNKIFHVVFEKAFRYGGLFILFSYEVVFWNIWKFW